ncbi:suppressor of fused domain protein [Thermomonospora cellulosilytica]|uniref:suppressor of fused domain protein n=1 Tax=Thermomonospora cellulosilytica TaxID=1411118 RepID=UPI001FEABD96|nr:suppressor of fused domain protein [Thermomonospora cellulosilytica]
MAGRSTTDTAWIRADRSRAPRHPADRAGVRDRPRLGTIDTPHGRVRFLTVIGVTADELARMKATGTAHVLAELAAASPLLITDADR